MRWTAVPATHSRLVASLTSSMTNYSVNYVQVTRAQLLEVGEGEFLEWCGLVVSKEAWRKKEIRVNTRHVYQQHK